MFCSEKCQVEAKKRYHNIECEVVTSYLQNNDNVDTSELLTLRIIATFGLDNLLGRKNIFEQVAFDYHESQQELNLHPNTLIDSDSQLFKLVSHDSARPFEEMLNACFIVFNMLKCFKINSEIKANQLGALILRLFLLRDSNAHTLVELMYNERENMLETNKIASGIFLVSSLVNHNCDPNVFRINYCNTLVHRAARYIEKGTQIMISYGVQFDKTEKLERQEYLQKYYFLCSCVACVENWPLKMNLPEKPTFLPNENDIERKFLDLIHAKKYIIAELSFDQWKLNRLNQDILLLLSWSNKICNQFYLQVEYEVRRFYRLHCALR